MASLEASWSGSTVCVFLKINIGSVVLLWPGTLLLNVLWEVSDFKSSGFWNFLTFSHECILLFSFRIMLIYQELVTGCKYIYHIFMETICRDNPTCAYVIRVQKYFNIAFVLQDEWLKTFHSSCKRMHLSFKGVCNKEHKGVICNMTSLSRLILPKAQDECFWEELLVLSRFHS